MFDEYNGFLLAQLQSMDHSWWLLIGAFFAGLLASLSPCVYPLIPITVASLAPKGHSQAKHIRNAAYYCLGFALLYASLGLLAALTGQLFGQVASNPWLQIGFANLLLYMALVIKGWARLPSLPFEQSNHQHHTFLMGAVSGLVAAPCTSPVLAALLLFAAEQQQAWLGAGLLFSFALGMSALLFAIGVSSHLLKHLPKSGKWLTLAPNLFAIMLVLVAQFYLIKAGQSIYF
ncbi:Thiol:disulfide interchange protein DsbD [Pseudoalteromonas holothuriae]|uniref:Thiol:disulfide interchange protein DsbD n=1 Tax=Pseudoalteromonas holothuriae TaxID=2963714 RepID=A0A9W4QZC6_9GAMM|nr:MULTISPECIES: cytochrome c biogenesis protein CcdA [unclassified Pseudoalteromonas]CAH9060022.1 Thiol:disulfide interchange protein DsbD [Pseudoalteromonas sp. CIP111854]CAH9063213.1 Thiol:disulfide interchange protein DsbD [Pseudoalteromonas sp. CIP111951]